jgi:hypothetical protein
MSNTAGNPENKGKGTAYDKVPADFLKGIFLTPHNFNDPENLEHGIWVNQQLRYDLFYSALDKVKNRITQA